MAHTIAAIATAAQPAAIGILRLSGDTAIETAQAVFTPQFGSALGQQPSRRLVLGTLRDRQGRVIDQAMAVVCRAPNSYTGEDTAELHCHGAPAVLAAGLEALYAAVPAGPAGRIHPPCLFKRPDGSDPGRSGGRSSGGRDR